MYLSVYLHNQLFSGTFLLLYSPLPVSPWVHKPSLPWGLPKKSSSQENTGNSEELMSLEGEGKEVSTTHSHISPKDHLPQQLGGHPPHLPPVAFTRSTSSLHIFQSPLPCITWASLWSSSDPEYPHQPLFASSEHFFWRNARICLKWLLVNSISSGSSCLDQVRSIESITGL